MQTSDRFTPGIKPDTQIQAPYCQLSRTDRSTNDDILSGILKLCTGQLQVRIFYILNLTVQYSFSCDVCLTQNGLQCSSVCYVQRVKTPVRYTIQGFDDCLKGSAIMVCQVILSTCLSPCGHLYKGTLQTHVSLCVGCSGIGKHYRPSGYFNVLEYIYISIFHLSTVEFP